MINVYQQHEPSADIEMVSTSELEYIIQDSIVKMEYEGFSIDQMAHYWGVNSITLYENINIYQNMHVKH